MWTAHGCLGVPFIVVLDAFLRLCCPRFKLQSSESAAGGYSKDLVEDDGEEGFEWGDRGQEPAERLKRLFKCFFSLH